MATLDPAADATATAQPPTATLTAPASTPTAAGTAYSVVSGDTLWAIAERFGLAPGQLLDANPGLDPDLIYPGDVLLIPDPNQPTPEGPSVRVRLDANGLRLRQAPSLAAEALTTLTALTRLDVVGRTADNTWLQVTAPGGAAGWVASLWLDIAIALDPIPVTGESVMTVPTSPVTGPTFVTGVSERALAIVRQGLAAGNRPNVFSKVGDSITVSPVFLDPIGRGAFHLQAYSHLQPVIDFYSTTPARGDRNSFSNPSLAAKVGWRARAVLSPGAADPAFCDPGETPLACEYRSVRPAVAVILLGTNDVPYTPAVEFDADLRRVLDATLERGILPVISTVPPLYRTGLEGRAEELNAAIAALADEYELPLVNFYAALQGLPDGGMAGDGVHPSWAPAGHNADFSPEYLQYGMVVRNLITLQALDAVYRQILQP